jgi:hypothetical protein
LNWKQGIWKQGIWKQGVLAAMALCLALSPVHGASGQEGTGESRMNAPGLPLLEQPARQVSAPLMSRKAPLLASLGVLLLLFAPSLWRPFRGRIRPLEGRRPGIYSFRKLQLEGG